MLIVNRSTPSFRPGHGISFLLSNDFRASDGRLCVGKGANEQCVLSLTPQFSRENHSILQASKAIQKEKTKKDVRSASKGQGSISISFSI